MATKSLSEYTDTELAQTIKGRKFIFVLHLIFVIIMIVAPIIGYFRTGKFPATWFLPLAFFPLLIIAWSAYKNGKNELKNRNTRSN